MSAVMHSAQPAYDAVVRPLSRAAQRPCARPGCPSPARATLNFAYERREAWLDALSDRQDPQAYDLCSAHAGRTRPPHGWRMRDRRPDEERIPTSPPVTPADLGSEHTVAVLAAALRAIPSSVPESGPRHVTEITPRDAGEAAPGGGPDLRSSTAAAPATGSHSLEPTELAAETTSADGADDLAPRRLASRPTLTFRHHATTVEAIVDQPAGTSARTLRGCVFATSW